MKNLLVILGILAIVALLYFGWAIFKESKETVTNYGQAQVIARQRAALAKVQGDLHALRGNIQLFQLEKGHFPTVLQEIVDSGIYPRVPKDSDGSSFHYNASTGEVTSRIHPDW